ncbi:hypothetical protein MJI37_20375, partial [Salmonella enterica subsp. enterica serovar Cerro]|nr:hypothetical protein [Salmonella enterica subsp. enterica serovar Cerro]
MLAKCCALHYLNKGCNSEKDYITPAQKGQSWHASSYLCLFKTLLRAGSHFQKSTILRVKALQ